MSIINQSGSIVETRSGVYPERSRRNACSGWFRFMQANGAAKTLATTIPSLQNKHREGRPQDPNTWSYQLTPFGALNITDRGYTFHVSETWFFNKNLSRTIPIFGEHLIEFSLINMNGRMYDPVLGRVISPDNYIQAPDNTQSFNRYSYCWNNPLKYSDPSGDIIFTALAVVTGQWWALPMAISADIGMWQGGTMANGTANPFKWDYSSARTWGYMGAGAAIGAASSYAGAGAGALLAKTTTLTANHVMYGALTGAVSGAVSGFAIGGLSGVANNGKWNWNSAWSGLGMGAAGGFVMGGATTAISNWIGGRNIWNGKLKPKPQIIIDLDQPSVNLTRQNSKTGVYEQLKLEGKYNPKLGNHDDFLVTNQNPDEVFNFLSMGKGELQPDGSYIYRTGNGVRIDYYTQSESGFTYTIQLRNYGSGTYLKLRWK